MDQDELVCRKFKQEFRNQILLFNNNADGQLFSYGAALNVFAKRLNNKPDSKQIIATWHELIRSVLQSMLSIKQQPSTETLQKFDRLLKSLRENSSVISIIKRDIQALHNLVKNGAWSSPVLQSLIKQEDLDDAALAEILENEDIVVVIVRLQVLNMNSMESSALKLLRAALLKDKFRNSEQFQMAFQTQVLFNMEERNIAPHYKEFNFSVTLQLLDKFERNGEPQKLLRLCNSVLHHMWQTDTVSFGMEITTKWCKIKVAEHGQDGFFDVIKSALKKNDGPSSVTHCLILVQAIWEMIGDPSREICVEILVRALHFLKKEEDPGNQNKIKILESIAHLLAHSNVARLCSLSVFFLQPCIETYLSVAEIFSHSVSKENSPIRAELQTELLVYINHQFPSEYHLEVLEWNSIKKDCLGMLCEEDSILVQRESSPDITSKKLNEGNNSHLDEETNESQNLTEDKSSLGGCVAKEHFKKRQSSVSTKEKIHRKFGWTCPVISCSVTSGRMNYMCQHLKSKHDWHSQEIRAFTKSLGVAKNAVWTSKSGDLVPLVKQVDNGHESTKKQTIDERKKDVNKIELDIQFGDRIKTSEKSNSLTQEGSDYLNADIDSFQAQVCLVTQHPQLDVVPDRTIAIKSSGTEEAKADEVIPISSNKAETADRILKSDMTKNYLGGKKGDQIMNEKDQNHDEKSDEQTSLPSPNLNRRKLVSSDTKALDENRQPGYVCPMRDCNRVFIHKHTIVAHIKFRHKKSSSESEKLAMKAEMAVPEQQESISNIAYENEEGNSILFSRGWYPKVDVYIVDQDQSEQCFAEAEKLSFRNSIVQCLHGLFNKHPPVNFNYNAARSYLLANWIFLEESEQKKSDHMEDDFGAFETSTVNESPSCSVVSEKDIAPVQNIACVDVKTQKTSNELLLAPKKDVSVKYVEDSNVYAPSKGSLKNLKGIADRKKHFSETVMPGRSSSKIPTPKSPTGEVSSTKTSQATTTALPIVVSDETGKLIKVRKKTQASIQTSTKKLKRPIASEVTPLSKQQKLMSFEEALVDPNRHWQHKKSSSDMNVLLPVLSKERETSFVSEKTVQNSSVLACRHLSASSVKEKKSNRKRSRSSDVPPTSNLHESSKLKEVKKKHRILHPRHSTDTHLVSQSFEKKSEHAIVKVKDYELLLKEAELIASGNNIDRMQIISECERKNYSEDGNSIPITSDSSSKSRIASVLINESKQNTKKEKTKRSIALRKLSSNTTVAEKLQKQHELESSAQYSGVNIFENVLSTAEQQQKNNEESAGTSQESSLEYKCSICYRVMVNRFALTCHMRKKHRSKAKTFIPGQMEMPLQGTNGSSYVTSIDGEDHSERHGKKSSHLSVKSKSTGPKNGEPVHMDRSLPGDPCAQANKFFEVNDHICRNHLINEKLGGNLSKVLFSSSFRKLVESKCMKAFETELQMFPKVLFYLDNGKYSCPFPGCNTALSSKRSITRHSRDLHDVDLLELAALVLGLIHVDKFNECLICYQTFDDPDLLETHFFTNHGTEEIFKIPFPRLKCSVCMEQSYFNIHNLTRHLNVNHQLFFKELRESGIIRNIVKDATLLGLPARLLGWYEKEHKDALAALESIHQSSSESIESFQKSETSVEIVTYDGLQYPPEQVNLHQEKSSDIAQREMSSTKSSSGQGFSDSRKDMNTYSENEATHRPTDCTKLTENSFLGQEYSPPIQTSIAESEISLIYSCSKPRVFDTFSSSGKMLTDSVKSVGSCHVRRLAYKHAAEKISMVSPEKYNKRKWAEFQNLTHLYNKRALRKIALTLDPAEKILQRGHLFLITTPSLDTTHKHRTCWLCKDVFDKPCNYTNHILYHLRSIDRYEDRCDFWGCLYGFKNEDDLKAHTILHDGGKPVCLICEETNSNLTDPVELLDHEERYHPSVANELSQLRDKFCINGLRNRVTKRKHHLSLSSSIQSESVTGATSVKQAQQNMDHFLGCGHRKHRRKQNWNLLPTEIKFCVQHIMIDVLATLEEAEQQVDLCSDTDISESSVISHNAVKQLPTMLQLDESSHSSLIEDLVTGVEKSDDRVIPLLINPHSESKEVAIFREREHVTSKADGSFESVQIGLLQSGDCCADTYEFVDQLVSTTLFEQPTESTDMDFNLLCLDVIRLLDEIVLQVESEVESMNMEVDLPLSALHDDYAEKDYTSEECSYSATLQSHTCITVVSGNSQSEDEDPIQPKENSCQDLHIQNASFEDLIPIACNDDLGSGTQPKILVGIRADTQDSSKAKIDLPVKNKKLATKITQNRKTHDDTSKDKIYDVIRRRGTKSGKQKKTKTVGLFKDPFRSLRGRPPRRREELTVQFDISKEWPSDETFFLQLYPSLLEKKTSSKTQLKRKKRSKSLDVPNSVLSNTFSESAKEHARLHSAFMKCERFHSEENVFQHPEYARQPTFAKSMKKLLASDISFNVEKQTHESSSRSSHCSEAIMFHTHTTDHTLQSNTQIKSFTDIDHYDVEKDIRTISKSLLDLRVFCGYCLLNIPAKDLMEHLIAHVLLTDHCFECTFLNNGCFFKCRTEDELKNHIGRHTWPKPFLCMFCCDTFADISSVESHQKEKHRLFKDRFYKELSDRKQKTISRGLTLARLPVTTKLIRDQVEKNSEVRVLCTTASSLKSQSSTEKSLAAVRNPSAATANEDHNYHSTCSDISDQTEIAYDVTTKKGKLLTIRDDLPTNGRPNGEMQNTKFWSIMQNSESFPVQKTFKRFDTSHVSSSIILDSNAATVNIVVPHEGYANCAVTELNRTLEYTNIGKLGSSSSVLASYEHKRLSMPSVGNGMEVSTDAFTPLQIIGFSDSDNTTRIHAHREYQNNKAFMSSNSHVENCRSFLIFSPESTAVLCKPSEFQPSDGSTSTTLGHLSSFPCYAPIYTSSKLSSSTILTPSVNKPHNEQLPGMQDQMLFKNPATETNRNHCQPLILFSPDNLNNSTKDCKINPEKVASQSTEYLLKVKEVDTSHSSTLVSRVKPMSLMKPAPKIFVPRQHAHSDIFCIGNNVIRKVQVVRPVKRCISSENKSSEMHHIIINSQSEALPVHFDSESNKKESLGNQEPSSAADVSSRKIHSKSRWENSGKQLASEDSIQCFQCGLQFETEDDLKDHSIMVHMDVICYHEGCRTTYNTPEQLYKHFKQRHWKGKKGIRQFMSKKLESQVWQNEKRVKKKLENVPLYMDQDIEPSPEYAKEIYEDMKSYCKRARPSKLKMTAEKDLVLTCQLNNCHVMFSTREAFYQHIFDCHDMCQILPHLRRIHRKKATARMLREARSRKNFVSQNLNNNSNKDKHTIICRPCRFKGCTRVFFHVKDDNIHLQEQIRQHMEKHVQEKLFCDGNSNLPIFDSYVELESTLNTKHEWLKRRKFLSLKDKACGKKKAASKMQYLAEDCSRSERVNASKKKSMPCAVKVSRWPVVSGSEVFDPINYNPFTLVPMQQKDSTWPPDAEQYDIPAKVPRIVLKKLTL